MVPNLPRHLSRFWGILIAALCLLPCYAQPVLVSGGTNFGNQNVGTPSTTTLTYTFLQTFNLTTPTVVTEGVVNADFKWSGGTCLTGTWNAGFSCTVQVTFTPAAPGPRMGGVVFAAPNGTVAATTYLQGGGIGAMPSLAPGVTRLSPPLVPVTVAVDPAGTVFLGSQANVNGVQTHGVFLVDGTALATGFAETEGTAIDGAGNIWVTDRQCNCVWKTTPVLPGISRTTTQWSPPSGVTVAGPIAVDGNGAIYLADSNSGSVLRISTDGGMSTAAVCTQGSCEQGVRAIAVDGAGNLYMATPKGGECFTLGGGGVIGVSLSCDGAVWRVPPALAANPAAWTAVWQGKGGGYFSPRRAQSIALDGAGTLWLIDTNRTLWKTPQGSAPVELTTWNLGLSNWFPWYIALDQLGNAYITDTTFLVVYVLAGANFIATTASIDGVCGSANDQVLTAPPSQGLCAAGTATAVTGGGPWHWSCTGVNGGGTASCGANPPPSALNGVCGTSSGASLNAPPASDLCAVGNPAAVLGSGPWNWTCSGLNGGNAASCTANLSTTGPVNGVCSGASGKAFNWAPGDLCAAGSASPVYGNGPWSWTCSGLRGGTLASCSTASASCGPGTSTTVASGVTPTGIQADSAGNVFWSYNQCGFSCGVIAKVGGGTAVQDQYLIQWAATGNGDLYYTSDTVLVAGGVRRSSCMVNGSGMVADSAGHLYVLGPKTSPHIFPNILGVSNISGSTCNVAVVAGGGSGCAGQTDSMGDGCAATSAKLSNYATALAVDSSGNVYVWDDYLIRRIDAATKVITQVADLSDSDSSNAVSMAVGPAAIYFTDGYDVYQVDGTTGAYTLLNIPNLQHPVGVAVDSSGNLYVADAGTKLIVKVAGTAAGNCAALSPENGYCGGAAYFASTAPTTGLCDYGSPSGVLGTGTGPWTWYCSGVNYGKAASCSTLPAMLTVTANNATMALGGPLPAFTASYSGFVNGDTASDAFTGAPAFSTTATAGSPVGTYPITVSRGTLDSWGYYNFTFVPGTLTVLTPPKAQIAVTAALTKQASGYQASVTITNSGNADAASVVLSTATLGTATGSPLPLNIGTVKAGAAATVTVTFPLSAGADGASVLAKYAGSYTGGTFTSSGRVVLP